MKNSLNIKPMSAVIGAEISGGDLRIKPNDEIKASLLKAITGLSVICIRNQDLKPENLVKVSRVFGTSKKYFIKDTTIDWIPEKMKTVIHNLRAVNKWQSRINIFEAEKLSKEEAK